jgi:integrase
VPAGRGLHWDEHRQRWIATTTIGVATGQPGRRSKSLSAEQADVLSKTGPDRLHPYIVVSLLTGARTEELRALGWEHVNLDGQSGTTVTELVYRHQTWWAILGSNQ